ncbi:hypothetical protein [[Phormidium] sp. ETS-05]|uniref:hypothetical protein n=1 Tax=[Phormidium] sp. ETS-05 TaxID=222819 RepID=UPI0018EF27A8|nr:hypothetical protein [[Phormidium] sp. ETS-05]
MSEQINNEKQGTEKQPDRNLPPSAPETPKPIDWQAQSAEDLRNIAKGLVVNMMWAFTGLDAPVQRRSPPEKPGDKEQ